MPAKKSDSARAAGMQSIQAKGKQESRGTIKIDSFTFNVRDYNLKGFILEPYDKDILAKGQKFKFEMKCGKDNHVMEGKAEAVVTKISKGALAASFTIKPSAP
jgi:hypothetical protein